jgi:hypothetical protein
MTDQKCAALKIDTSFLVSTMYDEASKVNGERR